MFVKKGIVFLGNSSLEDLENQYKNEQHGKAKLRLQCAILRKKGKAQPYIVEATGLPRSTVSNILRRFEERGVEAANAIKQTGQPRKLSQKQLSQLRKALLRKPIDFGLPFVVWTTKIVNYFIEKKFNVSYALFHIRYLLKSFGLSMQKPRPQHIKANKKLQKQFKKNFDVELNILGNLDTRSYFWTKHHSS